jgi:hypothetical protein
MKEKMLDFLFNNHWCSGRDHDIIESFIDDFFDQYQPERLNPEASKLVLHPIPDEVRKMFGRCDSPNSENK